MPVGQPSMWLTCVQYEKGFLQAGVHCRTAAGRAWGEQPPAKERSLLFADLICDNHI